MQIHDLFRNREVIIERVILGRYMRISAVDVASGIEVTIVGDPNQPDHVLTGLAMRKLAKRLGLLQ